MPGTGLAQRGQIGGGDSAGVNGARDEGAIAADVAHPLEVQPGQNAAPREKPDVREAPTERLEQAEIHTAPRPYPPQIKHQNRSGTGFDGLGGQAQRVRSRPHGILQRRMEHRISQPQIQTEDHPRLSHHPGDLRQIGKGDQSLQPNHHLAGPAGQHLQGFAGRAGARINHQGSQEAGMEIGQLPDQRPLNGATLNGIEVSDVALVNLEQRVKGPKQRNRVSDPLRRQLRFERRITSAVSGLSVYRHPASKVENGNDLHA